MLHQNAISDPHSCIRLLEAASCPSTRQGTLVSQNGQHTGTEFSDDLRLGDVAGIVTGIMAGILSAD